MFAFSFAVHSEQQQEPTHTYTHSTATHRDKETQYLHKERPDLEKTKSEDVFIDSYSQSLQSFNRLEEFKSEFRVQN